MTITIAEGRHSRAALRKTKIPRPGISVKQTQSPIFLESRFIYARLHDSGAEVQ
jgi:hypothetical protein